MVLQDYNDNCGALHIAGVSVLNGGLYFEVFKYNVFIAKDKYVVANMQKGGISSKWQILVMVMIFWLMLYRSVSHIEFDSPGVSSHFTEAEALQNR